MAPLGRVAERHTGNTILELLVDEFTPGIEDGTIDLHAAGSQAAEHRITPCAIVREVGANLAFERFGVLRQDGLIVAGLGSDFASELLLRRADRVARHHNVRP